MSRKNLKRQPRGGAILNFEPRGLRRGAHVEHVHTNRKRKGQRLSVSRTTKRSASIATGWNCPPCRDGLWKTGATIAILNLWKSLVTITCPPSAFRRAIWSSSPRQRTCRPSISPTRTWEMRFTSECAARSAGGRGASIQTKISVAFSRGIDGRVVGVLRNGHYVPIAFPIRPLINDAELGRIKPANDLIN